MPKRTAAQRQKAEDEAAAEDARMKMDTAEDEAKENASAENSKKENGASAASANSSSSAARPAIVSSFAQPPPGDPAQAIRDRKAIESLVEGLGAKANSIVHEILPAKIMALDQLYLRHQGLTPEAYAPSKTGALPNKQIRDALEEIKRETRDMIGHMDTLKIFVLLSIPTIEDQKDLSVAVKEEFAEMLSAGRQGVISVTNSISKYYATRGKLVSKSLKYPDIPDFPQSIAELDEKQFHAMVVIIQDLRNNYAVIYDYFVKNIHSISKPAELQEKIHHILY